MSKQYRLAEDTINNDDVQELINWLQSGPWLTQGERTREFQRQWADWLGTRFAVAVNSGSSANLLMYYALLVSGRLKNQKVVVPAISWPTTVTPAIQFGFEPLMCEAESQTWGLDLDHLETLLKEHNPGAVIIVHVLGVPNQMEQILKLRDKYGFVLMEDCCGAHGSKYEGKYVGTMGDLSSFSFYFGHHISTVEGGMVCTNDEDLYDILLHLRSHGWAKDLTADKEAKLVQDLEVVEFYRPFTFYYPGFNVRSTDLNSHLGLLQMKKLNQVIDQRAKNHRVYQSRFLDVPIVDCQQNERGVISSISFGALATSQDHRELIGKSLRENGIETRPIGGGNMSRQPFWADRYGTQIFPMADRVHYSGFQLPNHAYLTEEDIHHICDVVLSARP